jgi:hypothetical protein
MRGGCLRFSSSFFRGCLFCTACRACADASKEGGVRRVAWISEHVQHTAPLFPTPLCLLARACKKERARESEKSALLREYRSGQPRCSSFRGTPKKKGRHQSLPPLRPRFFCFFSHVAACRLWGLDDGNVTPASRCDVVFFFSLLLRVLLLLLLIRARRPRCILLGIALRAHIRVCLY